MTNKRNWKPLVFRTFLVLTILSAGYVFSLGQPNFSENSRSAPLLLQINAAPKVIFLGDSITAGLGLTEDQSYPALIQKMLAKEGFPHRVVNAGVSGDTTAGGLARLNWLLKQSPQILVVALGANDGLRGRSVVAMEKNLTRIISKAHGQGIQVLLLGMTLPTNYGKTYLRRFEAVYPRLAKHFQIPSIPFQTFGVAHSLKYNQPDGIHPNKAGAKKIAQVVWKSLKPLLEKQ